LSQINAGQRLTPHLAPMGLPFTTGQFLAVFAAYNAAIWPLQIAAYALGALVLIAVFWRSAFAARLILLVLALMWAVNGILYHFLFFAPINPAAKMFAALFLLQAALFAACALKDKSLRIQIHRDLRAGAAIVILAYSMIVYEALGLAAGHGLMAGPLFGVAPCPTAIFTIGLLILMRGRVVKWLAVIPLIWAVIGTSAAVLLGIREDLGLAAAGIALVIFLILDYWRGISASPGKSPA
jgi:Family of unknown function (DUF6064)